MFQSPTNDRYNNNQFLPKAGVKKTITPEQVEEIKKCYEDPMYFAEKYFMVNHQDHGVIPMRLYSYQREAIKIYFEKKRLIMATARQVGKTTVATVILLHAALFNPKKNIAILANKLDTAKEVLERIKEAYELLPDFLKGGVSEWNKKSVRFENGSKIFADATTGNSIRGKSLFLLYIDEAAHVDNWDEFSMAVLPTVDASKQSGIIFTSTPNGLNHFYDLYRLAKEGKSDYGVVTVTWHEVEGRDEAWKQRTLANLNFDEQKFAQEHEVEFIGSSGTLISGATLKTMQASKPIRTDGDLKFYKEPVPGHIYAMTVDVSRGKGLDYHCFQIIDCSTMPFEQVAVFHNNTLNAVDYAAIIQRVGIYYNEAMVLIELNDGLGSQIADILFMDYEYPHLLATENKGRSGKQIANSSNPKKIERGITLSATTKPQGCFSLKTLIETGRLKIVDDTTIGEFMTFSEKRPGSHIYQAEEGKHDDCVMPLVLFGWLVNQQYFKATTDQNAAKYLREVSDEEVDDNLMLTMGVVINGLEDDDLYDFSLGSPSDSEFLDRIL